MTTLINNAVSPSRMDTTEPAQAVNRRGIARFKGGDVQGALADFNEAARLDPNYAEPWNNSGILRQTLGQIAQAGADFDRALALRPDYPEALTNRARARQTLGDTAGARADLDHALELAGDSAFAASILHNRGMLRQHGEDSEGALEDFDQALRIDPAHTATYVCRGNLRKETGDLEGALADFDCALAQNPMVSLAAAYHGRGGVRVLRNDFAGAIADYDRALAIEPEQFHLYISRGNARYHKRDPRGVLDFRMAFRLNPDGAAREILRTLRGDIRRDAKGVLENCNKHLRINDGDVIAHARRGLTLLLLGRVDEAAANLAQVAALAPQMQAWLHKLIELSGATTALERAVPARDSMAANSKARDAVFADFGQH